MDVEGTYVTMCANNEESTWKYAGWNGAAYDPYDTKSPDKAVDILIVGNGIGAAAAAQAIAIEDPSLKVVVVGPRTSTSQKSTGVAWFPLNHNVTFLRANSHPFDEALVAEWIKEAPSSYAFWDKLLDTLCSSTRSWARPRVHIPGRHLRLCAVLLREGDFPTRLRVASCRVSA